MRQLNILLVDDQPHHIRLLEVVLGPLGENLVTAGSGEQAIEIAFKQDFVVILLDIHMQGIDGYETAERLRKIPRAKHTPIIFMTAQNADKHEMLKGYAVGAVDYLIKPVMPEILRAKVSTFVDLARKAEQIQQLQTAFSDQKVIVEKQKALLDYEHIARKRTAFLAEMSRVLASSLDYETTLKTITWLIVPTIADWCAIEMVDERGELRSLEAAHDDPDKLALINDMRKRYPPMPDEPRISLRVLKSGVGTVVPEFTDAMLQAAAKNDEVLSILRSLDLRSAMYVPLTAGGKTFGVLSLLTSDSDRRFTQDDLSLAEDIAHRAAIAIENARLYGELQRAIRSRDVFLSVAAHELKTPLTSLRGFAQLLAKQLERTGTIDPERMRRALRNIDMQSDKLTRLISHLLDISRLETGKLEIDPRTVNLAPLVQEVIVNAQLRTQLHTIQFDGKPSIYAHVDALRLEQVISNLLDNAIKYSPNGGSIEVSLGMDDHSVRLSVRDHGIGIPPENRERIFDRFYQAHTTSYYSGMGLGLFISQQIVELHQGQLCVEFPDDGGTCFIVTLPNVILPNPSGIDAES
jgi:signal transduction histidine kinase/CheY-like chemotaxis protein